MAGKVLSSSFSRQPSFAGTGKDSAATGCEVDSFPAARRASKLDGPGLLASAVTYFRADGVLTRDSRFSAHSSTSDKSGEADPKVMWNLVRSERSQSVSVTSSVATTRIAPLVGSGVPGR